MDNRSQTYIAGRRPIQLEAVKVEKQQVVETWEGARTAFMGDYILCGTQGEHWPVPGKQFDQLYCIISTHPTGEKLKVQKRTFEMRVYQTYEPLDFQVRNENFHAESGYFIVQANDNSGYPCEPNVFYETFEILRPAADHEYFNIKNKQIIS
jgi:hypothetical protein